MAERVYKRGNIYWGSYYSVAKGRTERVSLHTEIKEVAREELRKHKLAEANPAAHSRHTLADAIAAHFATRSTMPAGTRNVHEGKARHLLRVLGNAMLRTITREAVADYTRVRIAEDAARHTIYKELGVLRLCLREAEGRGWWSGDVRKIVPPFSADYVPKKRWLEASEVAGVFAEIEPHRRLWFAVAIYTGMRAGELARLRWQDIDWDRALITVRGTKTKASARIVPLAAPLATVAALHRQSTGPVLAAWGNVRRDVTAALARHHGHAVESVSPNDLRRTFGSLLIDAGVPPFTVAKMMGTSLAMIERVYGQLAVANLSASMAKIPDCTGEP